MIHYGVPVNIRGIILKSIKERSCFFVGLEGSPSLQPFQETSANPINFLFLGWNGYTLGSSNIAVPGKWGPRIESMYMSY